MPVDPSPVEPKWVALSIKQPWAALLAAGVKTIEVRTWSAKRRGPVLIHASKIPDDRTHGWDLVNTPELHELAEYRGGFIGVGDLSDCRTYESAAAFTKDERLHRNLTAWFRLPRLFGFVFRDVRPIPFYSYQGQTLFFEVKGFEPPEEPPLAAVVSANETSPKVVEMVLPPEAQPRRRGRGRTERDGPKSDPSPVRRRR